MVLIINPFSNLFNLPGNGSYCDFKEKRRRKRDDEKVKKYCPSKETGQNASERKLL